MKEYVAPVLLILVMLGSLYGIYTVADSIQYETSYENQTLSIDKGYCIEKTGLEGVEWRCFNTWHVAGIDTGVKLMQIDMEKQEVKFE